MTIPKLASVKAELAFSLGRRDEVPNVLLGQKLARAKDAEGVAALVTLLEDRQACADAVKALYECAELAPELLSPHAPELAKLLSHKNNRMIWGGMTALSRLANADADAVWPHWSEVSRAFDGGSVITRDRAVLLAAALSSSSLARQKKLDAWLMDALTGCRGQDLARWAEAIVPALSKKSQALAVPLLQNRLGELSSSAATKLKRLLKRTEAEV